MQVNSEYILKKRKLSCENSCFHVYLDSLEKNKELIVEDYLVVVPKNKNQQGFTGVAIVPIANDEIGLIKVYRPAVAQYGWEVPRGFIDSGETPILAAFRELKEETGLECPVNKLKELGNVAPDPGVLDANVKLFKAEITKTTAIPLENETGHEKFVWFNKQKLIELIDTGSVQDAITLVACYRAGLLY
jgi:ADP-ribose pyrophosphatase